MPSKAGGPDLESPLGYSDGTKFSRPNETPGVPHWQSAELRPRRLRRSRSRRPTTCTATRAWRDDERDADGDGLSNWLESARGPGQPSWWSGF